VVAIISGIEDAVAESETVKDGNAEALGSSAAEGEEIIGALRAAAMLATPRTPNGTIGQRIVQAAAGGGNAMQALGTVMTKQLTAMANIDVDVDGSENQEKRQKGDSGSGEMVGSDAEELISPESPLLVDEDRGAILSPPRAGGDIMQEEEDNERNAMLGAMDGEGDGEGDTEDEPLEDGEIREEDMGGRRTRRRRRNATKAKRGKKKTIKKRKPKRVNKKR